jgi:hypothetical protein
MENKIDISSNDCLASKLCITSNWKDTMGGLFLSIRTNFAKKWMTMLCILNFLTLLPRTQFKP